MLNILDASVREALDIVADTPRPAARVARTLEQIKQDRGVSKIIRVDNGPEMTAQVFVDWCEDHDADIAYIETGQTKTRLEQGGHLAHRKRTTRRQTPESGRSCRCKTWPRDRSDSRRRIYGFLGVVYLTSLWNGSQMVSYPT